MADSPNPQGGPLGGNPTDAGNDDDGWLRGQSYAKIAQRAILEDLLESPDRLMMLAVQENEVRADPSTSTSTPISTEPQSTSRLSKHSR
jgi:hypothetical protein